MTSVIEVVAEHRHLPAPDLLERASIDGTSTSADGAQRRAALACLAARLRILSLHGDRWWDTIGEMRTDQIIDALDPLNALRLYPTLASWAAGEGLAQVIAENWQLACSRLKFIDADPERFCALLKGRTLVEVDLVGSDIWAGQTDTFVWLITDEPRPLTLDASWNADKTEREIYDTELSLAWVGDLNPHPSPVIGHRLEGRVVEDAVAGTNPRDRTVGIAPDTSVVDRLQLTLTDGLIVCFDAEYGPGPCLSFGDHGSPLDPTHPRVIPSAVPTPPPTPGQPHGIEPEPDDLPF